jgi:hypothetical protein
MKITVVSTAAFLGLSLAAFAQAPKVNYNDHILPIFKNVCGNCHNPDKKKAGLDLTNYQGAMAGGETGPAVKPGNPDGSFIYKVAAHLEEPKMPPKGDKLSDADLKLLKDWIAGFALETANSKPAVAQANKVDSAVVSLTRPEGPAPMPGDLPLEPFVKARPLGALTTLAVSPWAPLVAIGGQKQIMLYNVESLDPLGVLAFPEGFPQVLRFSKNAKVLLAGGGLGGKSGTVVLWDVTTGERIAKVGNESDAVLAADLSADHQFVALGGPEKRVKVYQTKDGKQTGLIKKHTEWVTAIAFSPDGKYLGTADRNGGIEVWETAADPKPFNTLAGHKSAVTALAFMPGVLASGGEDGTIKLWNVKEGTESKSWNAHPGGVLSVDFTPDGRLVSCGRDKVAKVWDATGKAIATTEAFSDLALRAALNSERVIAADFTGAIRVYALSADGKANKVGELSANPPGIAEQLTTAEKTLSETNGALSGLQKAVSDAEARLAAEREAAEAKRKQELAAAESRKADSQQKLDAAKAAATNAEKVVNDLNTQLTAAKESVAKAEAMAGEKKKTSANNDRSKVEAEAAESAKKFDALTAEIARRREARSKLSQGSPEYAKADAEVQAIKPDLAKAQEAVTAAKAKLAGASAPPASEEMEAAKAAVAEAQKKAEALKQQLQQAQQVLSKVKEESPKQAADAEKNLASANADIAKLKEPAKPQGSPAAVAKAAELAKRVENINAELTKLREARSKFAEGSPEYAKANEKVQAGKQDLEKANAELANSQQAAAQPQASETEQALAKAKADLGAANQRLVSARAGVERWKRAQMYQTVFNARQVVGEKQAKHDDLVATAKDAFRQVDLTKQAITAAEQTIANGPKTISEKESALAEVRKAADAVKAQIATAEKAVADKKAEQADQKKLEEEIADLSKKLEAVKAEEEVTRAERNKFQEGTPERAAAQEKREAMRPKVAAAEAALATAKAKQTAKPGEMPVPAELLEAVKKAQLELKLANDKVAPAEKAIAAAKQSIADAEKQLPELKARIPQLEQDGAKTKAEAEKAATVVAAELEASKAELEKLRAQYEATKAAATKSASATVVVPGKI